MGENNFGFVLKENNYLSICKGDFMSNIFKINSEHNNTNEWLCMSNGYTDVFFSILVISGSNLAKKEREKEIVIWLAQHDQSRVGMGTVGFDLDEIPWTYENFEEEKQFLLRVIEGAIEKHGWAILNYTPGDGIIEFLKTFYRLVNAFTKEYVDPKAYLEWIEPDEFSEGFPCCEEHGVLLSCFGCILCNDGN